MGSAPAGRGRSATLAGSALAISTSGTGPSPSTWSEHQSARTGTAACTTLAMTSSRVSAAASASLITDRTSSRSRWMRSSSTASSARRVSSSRWRSASTWAVMSRLQPMVPVTFPAGSTVTWPEPCSQWTRSVRPQHPVLRSRSAHHGRRRPRRPPGPLAVLGVEQGDVGVEGPVEGAGRQPEQGLELLVPDDRPGGAVPPERAEPPGVEGEAEVLGEIGVLLLDESQVR